MNCMAWRGDPGAIHERTEAKIKAICGEADSLTVDMCALVEVENSDDIQFNIDELTCIISKLVEMKKQVEKLENSVSGCGVEDYDRAGNR